MVEKYKIVELKKANKSQREIAKILGCTEGYVSRIVKDYGFSNNIDNKFIGVQFGILTPIKRAGKDKHGHASYICACGCGNTLEVRGNSLETGNTSSCGCTSRKIGKEHGLWVGYEEISNVYYSRVKRGAKDRGFDFNITIEQMWEKFIEQKRRCALSGVKIMFAPTNKTKHLQTASLDRIDSNLGYKLDNIQWIHKHLNAMKWKISNEDFIGWCIEVANFQKLSNTVEEINYEL